MLAIQSRPPDFDPDVWDRLQEARDLARRGHLPQALSKYADLWDERVRIGDHYYAAIVAHTAGVAESDVAKKHEWNLRAIAHADQVADRSSVKRVYASNLNNLGLSYAQLGDQTRALESFEAALRALEHLQPGPYKDEVRGGIERNIARLSNKV